jgi:hypothetical protein
MDSQHHASHCIEIPPALAKAIVAAQSAGESLKRDGKGENGKYTTADEIAYVARQALTANGAAWVRLDVDLVAGGLNPSEIGNRSYVGDLVERWAIVHEGGGVLLGSSRMPVITNKQTPHDKAVGASLTYDVGGALRGALCMDREDKNSVDRREDHHEPEPAPKPKPAGKPKTTSDDGDSLGPRCTGKAAGIAKGIGERMRELVAIRKAKPGEVWADVLAEAGVEVSKYGAGPAPRSEALTVADGTAVRTYLVRVLGETGEQGSATQDEPPHLDAAGMGRLRAEVQKLYNRLCAIAPGDFVQGAWKAEWSRIAGLEEWPDIPTELMYRNVKAGLVQAVRSIEHE